MKIKLKNVIAVVFFLSAAFLTVQQVQARASIVVVGNNAPPFRIIEGSEFSGIYFDIIKEIGKRIGVDVNFVDQPFKRSLKSMENGTADLMLGPNRTAERALYMVYLNTTLGQVNKAFYVRPDSAVITGYNDLLEKQIAVNRGSVYFKKFDQDPSIKKQSVNNYEQAVKMLIKKRVDVIIIPELEGDYLLQQLGVKLKKSPFIVEGRPSYITISKKSLALGLQSKIEQALQEMRVEGKLQSILNRYSDFRN